MKFTFPVYCSPCEEGFRKLPLSYSRNTLRGG